MQEHSTKIFRLICEALGVFIQSLFAKEAAQAAAHSSSNQNLTNQAVPGSPSIDKVGNQSGFLYKGAWIPVSNLMHSAPKSI